MDPVWTLFSRRITSRLAYWLSALGYNLRDRSINNRIYLVYFCAFWAVWAIAVFALLGSTTVDLFQVIEDVDRSPLQVIITLGEYALAIWVLFRFWQVSRRSPMVFSEEDAYLLCQTPISRGKVGLAWLLEEEIRSFIPFAFGAVTLSFALVEWYFQDIEIITLIFTSLANSLRALLLVLLLQSGLLAVLWGIGAIRLHRRSGSTWIRLAFLSVLLIFLVGFLVPGLQRFLLYPLRMALYAAFLQPTSLLTTLVYASIEGLLLALALAFLYAQLRDINLSQAAQETRYLAGVQLARSYRQYYLVNALQQRQQLGTTRAESSLLIKRSKHLLFMKDLLQSLRTYRLQKLLVFAWIFGLSLGMFTASNWAFQVVMGGIWTVAVGGICTRRLRSDLARWWLLRQLPLRPDELMRDELLLSLLLCTAASWAGLLFSRSPAILVLNAAILLPLLAVNAALAASHDILRRSKARILMSPSLADENVPQQDIWGVLHGLASVLIPFGILVWSTTGLGRPLWGIAAFPISVLITYLNQKIVLSAFRWME